MTTRSHKTRNADRPPYAYAPRAEFPAPEAGQAGAAGLRVMRRPGRRPELGPAGTAAKVPHAGQDGRTRLTAQALAQSLATVAATAEDLVALAKLDGQQIYLNRAGQTLLGLDGGTVAHRTRVDDYLSPGELSLFREVVVPAVVCDGRWAGDLHLCHAHTGEIIDVHCGIVRIDDVLTGQPAQIAVMARDIRQQKAAAAALVQASRRKDEFLAVLGHELRNPMAPIRNAVEILSLLVKDGNPQVDWAMAVLDRQTTHLSRLLDDLLDVSRIVRGKLKLARQPVAVREIVQQGVDGVRSLMRERGQRLDVAFPAPGVLVEGDPVRLSQILLNLLLNAANYTQEGGEIRVATEADRHTVAVRITDNGPGIPPDRLDELFTPFSQDDRQPGGSANGLGLGLTISRRLAELHGGRLLARSDWPRPGSEFSLQLPRLARPGPALTPAPAPATEHKRRLRVLVVDDNADVAGALAVLLRLLGYNVETAASGAEALAVAARQRPRVALLDIGLPDMDGLDLARRLREQVPDPARLALVAITGYGHDEARERSYEAGFDEHLAKPVDLRTLQALLDRLG